MNGWIKLHRSLIKWEWYDDINVKVTFLHLLLSANHAPKKWRGIDIGRGQLWTSIGNLAKEIGLSEKQIRNSLKKLESTKEISIKGASKGTMITVCKYDSYQDTKEDKGEQTGKPKANEGRAKGEQRATNKNDNNTKNEKEKKETITEFDVFWSAGLLKLDRRKCENEWFNIDSDEYPKILEHVPRFVKASGEYPKSAFNYLKGRNWQDEDLPNYLKPIVKAKMTRDEKIAFCQEKGIKEGSAQYNRFVNNIG
jgi:predicted transcriptional regulator